MGGATADWGPSLLVQMLLRASQNPPAAYRVHDIICTRGTLCLLVYTLCSVITLRTHQLPLSEKDAIYSSTAVQQYTAEVTLPGFVHSLAATGGVLPTDGLWKIETRTGTLRV